MHGPARGPVKSHLERLIGRYGREQQIAVGRVRRWVSTMGLLGAFDRVQHDDRPRFALKRGVAIELRLRAGARATQDVDLVFLGPTDELIEAIDQALATPYPDLGTLDTRLARVEAAPQGPTDNALLGSQPTAAEPARRTLRLSARSREPLALATSPLLPSGCFVE